MAYQMDYAVPFESSRSERAAFIRRTYAHLAGAILAFVVIEALIFNVLGMKTDGGRSALDNVMMHYFSSPIMPFILMIGFIGSSYLARYWATNGGSAAMQYAGLGLYVVVEAVIFVPLLWICTRFVPDSTNLIGQAGVLTLCLFAGLSSVVFITRKDFSFLGPILMIASFVALGFIVCAMIFGFSLGLLFSLAMIVLAAGAILYDTSNILHHYRMDQHVAAALGLFASVAMLFYYVLLALMQSRRS
jgi:FtsH-binding integral membrane protein